MKLKLFWSIAIALIIEPLSAQNVEEYSRYMRENGKNPVEYIFETFKKSDVVILGERDHRDTTQYNFILQLLADPRFAEEIGYVYTEVGVSNLNDEANLLIKGEYASHDGFYKTFIDFHRYEDYYPLWEKYNRYQFINGLYQINRNLSTEKKITLGLTDLVFDWRQEITPEAYRKVIEQDRDYVMAEHFLTLYHRQKPIMGQRKALLITNQPHAVDVKKEKREGYLIKRALGKNKVSIILLNWYDYRNKTLYANGMWDAAFEQNSCNPIAVSFQKTPFGRTKTGTFYPDKRWNEIADGMIFYTPFYRFVGATGIPGIIDANFKEEITKRHTIYDKAYNRDSPISYEELEQYYNTLRTFPCSDHEKEQIKQLQEALNKE